MLSSRPMLGAARRGGQRLVSSISSRTMSVGAFRTIVRAPLFGGSNVTAPALGRTMVRPYP